MFGRFWTRRPRRVAGGRRALGARGEAAAARFLKRAGYRVLSRNLRLGIGEIDLLCEAPDRRTIVIVEVKARAASADGGRRPEDAITAAKGRKLAQLARAVQRRRGVRDRPLRIDVVAVEFPAPGDERGAPAIRHHPNAIGGDGRAV